MFGFSTPLQEQSQTRRNVTQGMLVGGGFAGAGTVVLGAVELIRAQPDKAFTLMERWGPWFFLAIFSVWAANGLMNRGLDVVERIGERFADSVDKIANEQQSLATSQERLCASQEKMASAAQEQAVALQRTADKDDREQERMATLVEYSGQQSRQAVEAIGDLANAVHKIADRVEQIAGKGN